MKALYIHIPFCDRICNYCDFAKIYYSSKNVKKYFDSLEYEIKQYYKNDKVSTIYIGGGTPSCLNYSELEEMFSIINKLIDLSSVGEYTIECNIDSIDEEKLKLFKSNNVNRISIGIQSFNLDILSYLNRNNNVDIISIINLCKKYFSNINIDLLYGIPGFDINYVKKDINLFLSLDIPHISCYSLIIEPHTKLYINNISNIDEDEEVEMYKYIKNTLEQNGYIHYEVSNYCKKGYESNHNLTYWNNEEYYGFGCGASGFIDGVRYSNTRSLTSYLDMKYNREEEKITKKIDMENQMILGLRKLSGVNKSEFYKRFGCNILDVYKIDDLLDENKLVDDGTYIKISEEYIYLSNEILTRFID